MVWIVVIIHVRFAASRARRVMRPTNIRGEMPFHLMGLRSRLKERHEERKGKRGPEGQSRRRRTAAGPLSPFSQSGE